jgi:hypothetical protein
MKTLKFTEERIAFTRRQTELGTPVREVIRKVGGHRADLLPMEEEVRWPRNERAKKTAPALFWIPPWSIKIE